MTGRFASWVGAALLAGIAGAGPGLAQETAPPADPALNPAGLDLTITPPGAVAVGTSFGFHVASRQPGYLVLLDVNAEGTISQLYPNVFSMKVPKEDLGAQAGDPCDAPAANTLSTFGLAQGANTKANRIEPGRPFELPGNAVGADYAFQACPPKGTGMIFAVLSDKPVQIIDLPDIPAGAVGSSAGYDRLIAGLRQLRLVSGEPGAPASAPRWSVAWVRYEIR